MAKDVCFGDVAYVRRRWVSKCARLSSIKRESVGCWCYYAGVVVLERIRLVMISRVAFEELVAKGSKRLPDACRHPNVGAPPPGPTVKE